MSVGEVCNREVVVVEPGADAAEASRLMREFHVGDLVVVERRGDTNIPLGIVTDRDLVIEVMAEGVAPESVSVKDLMTRPLVTACDSDAIIDALHAMRERGLRRLPVVNSGGALVGILTVDDILDLLAEELSDVVTLMMKQRRQEKRQRP